MLLDPRVLRLVFNNTLPVKRNGYVMVGLRQVALVVGLEPEPHLVGYGKPLAGHDIVDLQCQFAQLRNRLQEYLACSTAPTVVQGGIVL